MGHTHMWRRGNMLGKGGEASMRHPRIAEFYPSITKPQKHTSSDFTGSVTERADKRGQDKSQRCYSQNSQRQLEQLRRLPGG